MKRQSGIFATAALGASLFMLAGAGAVALSDAAAPRALIKDIRLGERGLQTRVAIFCDGDCAPVPRGDGTYFLPGAADSFDLDISEAGTRAKRIEAITIEGGAALVVRYDGAINETHSVRCTVSGREAVCLDLFFEDPKAQEGASQMKVAAAEMQKPAPEKSEPRQATRSAAQLTPPAPTKKPVRPMPAPGLRESQSERYEMFAKLGEPERLSPPILAKVQPVGPSATVSVTAASKPAATPAMRASQPVTTVLNAKPLSHGERFAARIETLLGVRLTASYCSQANGELQSDAWALDAMVDVGLCAAARGSVVEAESILSRLLEYTPDNYEALAGKAVIAELAGERGAALRFYQDALDASPPIKASARIVEAMAALS